MLKILYTILFSLCFLSFAKTQDIHQIKEFSDEQFNKGNYQLSLKEYQRVLLFNDEKEYNELYSKIASIYYQMSDFDLASKYYDFALRVENNDSLRFELALKKTLCDFNKNNYLEALSELYDLPDPASDFLQKRKDLYMGICYFGLNDFQNSSENFSKLLDSTGMTKINNLFLDFNRFSKKFRPEKVELMSIILPGLGQVYTGEIFSGLNSFFLITGITFYAMVTAVNYTYFDGLLVLSSWFYRYYSGGYTNASTMAVNKIKMEKTKIYSEIITLVECYHRIELE
ncbi:MAG: hypothetical protein MUC93_13490 [Bacteroidales bacterium]|jgi:tetratricopeptide (TPR) repeat protein|nr:hypothetical protein [Bacteroidales bacterium]